MPPLVTEAIVLHAFDYLESSRIVRLVTRDGGVRSALARGARRSSRRFGTALDIYAQGMAELYVKPGRELDTLATFDVVRSRPRIAGELSRFTGASAVAELTLRFAGDAADPAVFEAVAGALDLLGDAPAGAAREATLAGAWRILAALGVAPIVDACAECHAPIGDDDVALFSHPAGGALCQRCARLVSRGGRSLPPSARAALRTWLAGGDVRLEDDASARAHQRLLREFLHEHLSEGRPLRAFEVWERAAWDAPHETPV
jgi:DNA repair protein RecO (recombination protein O)